MKTTRHIVTVLSVCVLVLASGCDRSYEKTVESWPDGTPHVVHILKGKKKGVKIGEKRYYENGQLQCEKHYDATTLAKSGLWKFYFDNGELFAEGKFDASHPMGKDWIFAMKDGERYNSSDIDSVRVLEFGEAEVPATILFHKGDSVVMRQFYSIGALRSEGMLVGNQREGSWRFYFSNGMPQTEATFVHGREEGTYTVYRETGTPYYRGQYHDGRRVGKWEVYDNEANLIATQDY